MPNLKNKKVIKDQQGQRKYPGRVTEIQGNTMSTTGYGDIPLYVVPNVGNPIVVPANSGNRVFPGASSFTEYPIAKNGGWLEKYGDGGKTDQNPLLKSKTLLLEGNDENPQDLGPDANRSGFGINDKKIHISDNRKIRATTGKKINPNVALKTGDYDENVIDSLIKYSVKYNINPNRVLAQGLAESAFGKEDSQNIGHLKNFYRNESPYPQMMEAILEGDSLAKTNKNKKTTREEIIQGYNRYGKLFPETEKDYHGGNSKGFYEVPFGKEGYLDMDKNPLYGIEIKDLMDNVISKDAQIQYKILKSKNPIKKEFYNPNNVKIPYRRKDFKYGGWLDTYEDGGETDPPVNLRSASTQLASPVSTQAPEVPLNKTGWDWVKQKYENRQPSEWNMLMMDKSGSYVDSGVDPFSLMLTAPQQVIKAGVKGGKALLDASKSNKIKQVIHEDELRDIENLKKSFKEAQELKNKDVNTVEIYKNIKSGENWKYPNINITKEQYNSAKNNLKIGPYTAISFAKNNTDKIIIPSKSDNLFKNTPSGNTFYQFYGEGPMSNHTIYTPDIHDYINKYHPYTTSRANLESIDLARKDGLKDVSKYFKENFKDYKIPINDFISLPQNKYGGIVKTLQNKQDNSQWLDKYK